eukprot:5097824-Ditylum_brightwellii.AAC.1
MSALKPFPRKKAPIAAVSAIFPIAPRFPVPNHVMGDFLHEQTIAGAEKLPVHSPMCLLDEEALPDKVNEKELLSLLQLIVVNKASNL